MDFNDTPEEAAFRKEVRAFLEANARRRSPSESWSGSPSSVSWSAPSGSPETRASRGSSSATSRRRRSS